MLRAAEEQVRRDVAAQGFAPPPPRAPPWDHNVISPGTCFMEKLSKALQWYIHERVNRVPAWQCIKVLSVGPSRTLTPTGREVHS